MDGTRHSKRARAAIAAATATFLALPAMASAPAAEYISSPQIQPVAPGFEDHFASFDALPTAPAPSGNVVDIDAIEPPVEIEEPAIDTTAGRSIGSGVASYYGRKFNGRRTASGERFDMNKLTAAHKKLPFGTKVRVTNPRNGKSVVVTINDRGPYAHGRTIDLSRAAAEKVGIIGRGHGTVELALLD